MDKILKAYLDHAAEIIGHRSPSEIAHDDVVVEALRQGHSIKEALASPERSSPMKRLNGTTIILTISQLIMIT
jgi:hypothetical protein